MIKTQVQSMGWGDPLEKGIAAHCSILIQKIPWTEEHGKLQVIGLQSQTQLGHTHTHTHTHIIVLSNRIYHRPLHIKVSFQHEVKL